MKTEKIERTEYDITYIADDGTRFKSKEECEKYEETAFYAIKKRFVSIAEHIDCMCGDVYSHLMDLFEWREDSCYYRVTPQSEADIQTIIMFARVCDGEWITSPNPYSWCVSESELKVGETYIISYDGGDVTVYSKEKITESLLHSIEVAFTESL